jgi:hypothetical protein
VVTHVLPTFSAIESLEILSLTSFRSHLKANLLYSLGIESQKCAACVSDRTKEFGMSDFKDSRSKVSSL